MCRFSVTNAPPPAPESPSLQQLLDDDDFCWFAAIDDLPDEQLLDTAAPAAPAYAGQVLPARDSDSSAAEANDAAASDSKESGQSGTSSYDLMQLFKQQVEQDPAVLLASAVQAQYAFAAVPAAFACAQQPAALDQMAAAGACAAPSADEYARLSGYSAASFSQATAAAQPGTAAAAAAAHFAAAAPAMMPPVGVSPMDATMGSAVRKPGGRTQRTQAEVDAAVERIKQKRRESAQRSRARKNEYMRQLELENQGLKEEVHRLQTMLAAMQRGACMQPQQLVGV